MWGERERERERASVVAIISLVDSLGIEGMDFNHGMEEV